MGPPIMDIYNLERRLEFEDKGWNVMVDSSFSIPGSIAPPPMSNGCYSSGMLLYGP